MENKTESETQRKRLLRRILLLTGIGILVYVLAAFFSSNISLSAYRFAFGVILFVLVAIAYLAEDKK